MTADSTQDGSDEPIAARPWHEGMAQSVLDALSDPVVVLDHTGRVVAHNVAWRQLLQNNSGDLKPLGIGDNYASRLRDMSGTHRWAGHALAGLGRVLAGGMREFEMDYDIVLAGSDRTFSLSAVPLSEGGALVTHTDITWRKALERQLSHRATHDALTGLPNRALLSDRLTQALQRAARTGTRVGVLFADLDQFKVINDTLGHAAGDQVIAAVARRIESVCRAVDSVTRFGGDEFVVVVEDVETDEDVRLVAERVRESATTPLSIDGVDLWFGTSIGYVITDGSTRGAGRDADNLLRDADTAMYRAKDLGRNRIVMFDDTMREDVEDRMEMSMSLRHALERGELAVVYQPEFSCGDNRVVGAEALLRWNHPTRGLIGPSHFIEAAEEGGLIMSIGEWVLDQACEQAAEWSKIAGPGFSVAVNLSSQQLVDPNFVSVVTDCLDRHRLEASRLVLELTESALMKDPVSATEMLERLSELGVWISVDDFGTGYSSLSYLQKLPVDILKIDRSFIGRIAETPKATALVHGIVDLAHALGLLTVAEGIEEETQLLAAVRARCDVYQGYLSGVPGPAEAVTELLKSSADADQFTH